MMNSKKYIKVVKKKVVADLANAFPDGSGVFQHNSAPFHKAKKVMDYLKKMKITILDLPGNSTHLNPIENLWSIVKLRLRSEDCTTKTKLIEAIINSDMVSGSRNLRKVSNVGGFCAKQGTISCKERWRSYHVSKLMYCT